MVTLLSPCNSRQLLPVVTCQANLTVLIKTTVNTHFSTEVAPLEYRAGAHQHFSVSAAEIVNSALCTRGKSSNCKLMGWCGAARGPGGSATHQKAVNLLVKLGSVIRPEQRDFQK